MNGLVRRLIGTLGIQAPKAVAGATTDISANVTPTRVVARGRARVIRPGETAQLTLKANCVSPSELRISVKVTLDGNTEFRVGDGRSIAVDLMDGTKRSYFGQQGNPAIVPIQDPLNTKLYIGVTCQDGIASRNYPGDKPAQDCEFWSFSTRPTVYVDGVGVNRVFSNAI